MVGYSFLEPPDPLARFSHSLMHRTCFGNWDQRSTFIAKFNALFGPHQQMDEHRVVHTRPWWKLRGLPSNDSLHLPRRSLRDRRHVQVTMSGVWPFGVAGPQLNSFR